MKTQNYKFILNVILSMTTFATAPYALAEKMNSDTEDLVIKKMERVLSMMDKQNSSWTASELRLADLLAERARNRFMKEVELSCKGCKGSIEDRQKAIAIYENLIAEVSLNEHGPLLFQLAHLYESIGQDEKSLALFQRIIKEAKSKKISSLIVAKAHVGLGDAALHKNNHKEALEHYSLALTQDGLDNRALVSYNKAWCEFNLEQTDKAIRSLENILKDPTKITRDTEEGSTYDSVFHMDVLRDLATFYARRGITSKEIRTYEGFVPQEKRKEFLLHFSQEADRLGQKKAAHEILNTYMKEASLTKQEKLQAFVSLAQVNYDRGQSSQSTEDFARAAAAYQDGGCDDSVKCLELQKTMKHYVTELHRSKKTKPDQDLINAYLIYGRTFPNDSEMLNRGSSVAISMNNYTMAIQFDRAISASRSFSAAEKEAALLAEVSAAETSNDPSLQKECYIHFIKNTTNEEKKFEVRYQYAYLFYQQKQLKEAAIYFHDLTTDQNGKIELRKKSADLSLDALAQIKDDSSLEDFSLEYAKTFPQHHSEFEKMARKALMNRVARLANDKNSKTYELKSILARVLKTPVNNATTDEKILFYTNIGALAQKVNDQDTYLNSQQSLLTMPGLNTNKKKNILQQLANYYEKKLDFKKTYFFASQIHNLKENSMDSEYQLGTLADLANLNPEKNYRAALKAGLKGERSLIVRSRLVLLSSDPAAEFAKQAPALKQNLSLLNETLLFAYAKSADNSQIKTKLSRFFAMKELKKQSAPRFLAKQNIYARAVALGNNGATLQLNSKTTKALQKSTEVRSQFLAKADGLLNESLRLKDVTAQILSLNIVGQENERFVRELAALPAPQGLSAKEQSQYSSMFKVKLKPFLYKAKMAQQKLAELWSQSSAIAQLVSDYKIARPEMQKMMAPELTLLTQVPGKGAMKKAVELALLESAPSMQDLTSARQMVSENPVNVNEIEKLKNLETKMGHPLMPSYLEARLNHIQKEHSL